MKDKIKTLTIYLLPYLGFAFALAEWNPFVWSYGERLGMAIFYGHILAFYLVFKYFEE